MQYNRVVFDEFVPTMAGLKDPFDGFHIDVDPSITFEFSQSVYRFGHSMLVNTVDRFDTDWNTITDTHSGDNSQLGLFEAFLNPLALFNAEGKYYAITDQCPKCGGSLGRGLLKGMLAVCTIQECLWNIKSGICKFDRSRSTPTYKVIEQEDGLYINI